MKITENQFNTYSKIIINQLILILGWSSAHLFFWLPAVVKTLHPYYSYSIGIGVVVHLILIYGQIRVAKGIIEAIKEQITK